MNLDVSNGQYNLPKTKFISFSLADFKGKLLSDSILDFVKCPVSTFSIFMYFLVGALPEVQNDIRKQFSYKVLYNAQWGRFNEKIAV